MQPNSHHSGYPDRRHTATALIGLYIYPEARVENVSQ